MRNQKRTAPIVAAAVMTFVVSTLVLPTAASRTFGLADTAQADTTQPEVEPAPPTNQTYTGAKECASCHFKQFMSWKKTKHSKTFELLPAKYQKDPACLKCHATGFGKPTGFKDMVSTPALAGNTCEMCHGPGSEHSAVCKKYGKKKLSAAEEKLARDTIWKMIPRNICVECHKMQGHGEPATPKELLGK